MVVKIDVMLGEKFVCTLDFHYNSTFIIKDDELVDFVLTKRPSLKGNDFRIAF